MTSAFIFISLLPLPCSHNDAPEIVMHEKLQAFVKARQSEFDTISTDRKAQLKTLADYVSQCKKKGTTARLNFICTHNSRRSHMGQIWATVAAATYAVDNTQTYSGGTEATAFNPRAVAALQRAGLHIIKTTDDENPIYHVTYAAGAMPITSFSKVFDGAPNPKRAFCAIMTCSSADDACPNVAGADQRIAITYEDPKAFDGTPKEAHMYDERCAQIAREMLYMFSLLGAVH